MSYAGYALNIYEALVNLVAADVVLILRSKRMPGLEHMLKFGFEKAIISVLGSFIVKSVTPMVGGINELDVEYLSAAIAAGVSSTWNRMPATYLAMEQLLISLISHKVPIMPFLTLTQISEILGSRQSIPT
jgi:hypothetical protein